MMPDFTISRYHGDTLVLPVAVTDSAGDPISLVGATIKFKMGTITHSTIGYSIARSDAAGTFAITLSAAIMEALTDTNYAFAVEVVYASGIKETLFVGRLDIVEDVVP